MKNINLIALFIFAITLTSCSSNNNDDEQAQDSEFYISFEINNKKTTYTNVISASTNYNSTLDIYGISILGGEANTALSIYLYDTAQISTKTYTGNIIPNKYISSAIISYGSGSEGFTSAAPNISSVANASVTVTEISTTFIAGTFTGVLVSNSDYSTVTHTIKNGKFKLKFLVP